MANGIPVRLSEALTTRARSVAAVQDRSLTEQVEHWARLGQVVEAAVSSGTMMKLKARSYDAGLDEALAYADTAEGRSAAAELIRAENDVRYEEIAGGIVALTSDGTRTRVAAGKSGPTGIAAIHEAAPAAARSARRKAKPVRNGAKLRAVADGRATVKLKRR
jgi:hypothetical protein